MLRILRMTLSSMDELSVVAHGQRQTQGSSCRCEIAMRAGSRRSADLVSGVDGFGCLVLLFFDVEHGEIGRH